MNIKEKLLASLDFEKIHQHMVAVGWKYWDSDDVPSIDRLKVTAHEIVDMILSTPRDNSSSSGGGFHAHKWTWETGIEYELIFAVDSASIDA